jgi:NifU-like protein involved in Fe-S cluster formation
MSAPEPIDYDRVWADYLRALVGTLRSFSSGIAGLELWVPNEDPLISFRHLLDAALAGGMREIAVRFGPASRAGLSAEDLQAVAGRYGEVVVDEAGDSVTVSVTALTAPAFAAAPVARDEPRPAAEKKPRAISNHVAQPASRDVYAAALLRAAQAPCHQVAAEVLDDHAKIAAADRVTVTACCDGVQLQLDIDRVTHIIAAAHFSGTPAPPICGLLESFCALITGLPLLEAAQHGVLRLEAALRDPTAPPPVPGIILPQAAHPRFALPTALIRDVLAVYRARTGYAELRAPYHLAPAPAWLAAPPAERHARLAAAIAAAGEPQVIVTAIEHDVRVVLALPEELSSNARQSLLMRLERVIKRDVDPRLEIHAEERKDRNKLRRLAVVEPRGQTKSGSGAA